jgi:hypothetical protein
VNRFAVLEVRDADSVTIGGGYDNQPSQFFVTGNVTTAGVDIETNVQFTAANLDVAAEVNIYQYAQLSVSNLNACSVFLDGTAELNAPTLKTGLLFVSREVAVYSSTSEIDSLTLETSSWIAAKQITTVTQHISLAPHFRAKCDGDDDYVVAGSCDSFIASVRPTACLRQHGHML